MRTSIGVDDVKRWADEKWRQRTYRLWSAIRSIKSWLGGFASRVQ